MIDGGLRKLFRKNLPEFHWQSIETGGVGLGVPDSNFCRRGREGWIEFKQTSGWAVTLEPEQAAWLDRRARAGGRVWIAVRRWGKGPRRGTYDELWLIEGKHALAARREGLRGTPGIVAVHAGGPAGWDWRRIAACLTA